MEGVRGQYLQNQHKGLAFGSLNFSDHLGLDVSSNKNADVLSQEVQNLALKDSTKGNGTVERNKRHYYPLRPEAENCLFFMRYGWCKYVENCRYNHQFNGRSQADYKENAKLNEENLYRMAQVECKYYLTPQGCKHGKACRYNHIGRKTEKAPVLEFNFLGLPIRPGEKECPQYMRNGSCKYGSNCWFDHPDPSSMGEGFPFYGYTGWEDAMYQPAQCAPHSEGIGYQANKELEKPNEENLNRLAQVECKYYLTPEGCKHGEACRYNHSGRKTEKAPVSGFNFLGLPVRPGEKECPQYKQNGSCNYGTNCWFDHPDPLSMGEGFPFTGYTGWEDARLFWPLAGPVNGFGPVEANMYQPAQYAPYSEWTGYQG